MRVEGSSMEPGEGHTTGRVALTSALTSLSHNVGSKHKPKLNTHVLALPPHPPLSLSLSLNYVLAAAWALQAERNPMLSR